MMWAGLVSVYSNVHCHECGKKYPQLVKILPSTITHTMYLCETCWNNLKSQKV